MLIRRAGLAMGIFFLYMIIEQFVVSLGRNKYKQAWVDYLPEEVSDRLIPQPFARRILAPDNNALWEKHVPLYLSIAVLIYYPLYIFYQLEVPESRSLSSIFLTVFGKLKFRLMKKMICVTLA